MSLPPEQINIKRRREEEPVETLYIQSELHQTKRRFTDFVFQRVQVRAGGDQKDGSPSPSPLAPTQRKFLTPRSVSSVVTSTRTNRAAGAGTGIPLVRATSPGAEVREERRLATVRRENEEKFKRALHSSPTASPSKPSSATDSSIPDSGANDSTGNLVPSSSSGRRSPASSPGRAQALRRFQISRSNTPMTSLRSTGGGVQKRKGDGAVAVLVEKLRRTAHSRQASMVADAAARADEDASEGATEVSAPPRKRPVVNQAERKWREERKSAISAAKQHISQVLDREAQATHQSNWDDESERLARELEQVALELDGEMEVTPTETDYTRPPQVSAQPQARSVMPKPPLRYQPRTPNKHRAGGTGAAAVQGPVEGREESDRLATPATGAQPAGSDEDESDGEYVYDTYIRKPLPDGGLLTDPLVSLDSDQEAWFRQHGIDVNRQDIGVIVITQEDEEYWENFVEEEDEDRWDSEDADSNAENNPANDYPDEDLSWDDEEDDPTAIYNKYRTHGRSDDEEFDFDDSASEGRNRGGYGFLSHVESDEEW
ncbi:hypothetical protein BO70DRAFT_21533 [Aspergillus heteromorphus CBS 117.55]|uniref:Transcription factor Iwr1 domain-containing protein n=1 Tax=Aspergillus heteromorphus CBS 117.55 TaxID=1448321 RepID=A0A317X5S8_9EURO|nr:uncharacterized protein BO70DRAFT_21533 [Aspergillus heteromorphus CBS 117.55]PWY92907.1 hypothetical protein BO70DRAFT_21533 [Aspergillus heteromorphus CBS 117.55]